MTLRRFSSDARNEIIKTIKRSGFNISESFRFNIDMSLNLVKKSDQTKSRQLFSFWTPKTQMQETHMALEGVYYNDSYKAIINTNLHLIGKNILIYKADEHMELSIYRIDNGIINEIHTCNIPFQLCYSDIYLGFSDFYVYYDENKSILTGFFSKNDLESCLNKPISGFSTNKFINRIENEIKWVTTSTKSLVAEIDSQHSQYSQNAQYSQHSQQQIYQPINEPITVHQYEEPIFCNNDNDNNIPPVPPPIAPMIPTETCNLYYTFPSVPTKIPVATAPPVYYNNYDNYNNESENMRIKSYAS